MVSIAVCFSLCLVSGNASAGGASVTGTIKFADKQPRLKKHKMSADPACAAKHTEPVRSEAVLVNENGTLRNVFVYVKNGLEGMKSEPPSEPVVLDQTGCVYVPHVIGVQAGQPVKILNSDGILHNVHPKPKANREFNLAMPKFLKQKTKTFEKPEVMIPIKCDVHPWMLAYIGVVDHPFHDVTGEAGAFELKALPAGTYTIEAWHEICGTQTQEVTVKEGETATVSFTFKLPPRKAKK
jgi:plastocyanin